MLRAPSSVVTVQSLTTDLTQSKPLQPTSRTHSSRNQIEVLVPVAVITVVLLTVLTFFISQNQKQKRRFLDLQTENRQQEDPKRLK